MDNNTLSVRLLIIGAGFAGLGLAVRLRQSAIDDFLILEKAGELGGTWRDNDYPGAACDVPSHLYSFSFAMSGDWSRKFAPQEEILAYQRQLAERHDLRRHIRFGCEVAEARFDEALGAWRVATRDGERFLARVLVSGCGQLNRPALPSLPGIERFRGEAFHSARWNHHYDLTGKRVAVIGTGASAIQFVPRIAVQVGRLYLCQRSAAYVLAKPDRRYRPWERALKRRLPVLQRLDRLAKYLQHESRVFAFSIFPALMKLQRLRFRWHLARAIGDRQLRRRLMPDYPIGCKRILLSNDYYPALARDNVELVDTAIREVGEDCLVTADGQRRPIDAIIYGTGFRATEFLAPMQVVGRGGISLTQAWKDGAEAYLGVSVHGFPNLFLLYGPNTNLGHNSILYMLESQFNHVLGCLRLMERQGLRWIEPKASAQAGFNLRLQQQVRRTVWEQGCNSWYKTATGRNTNNWPGFTFDYRHRTRHPELEDYDCVH